MIRTSIPRSPDAAAEFSAFVIGDRVCTRGLRATVVCIFDDTKCGRCVVVRYVGQWGRFDVLTEDEFTIGPWRVVKMAKKERVRS